MRHDAVTPNDAATTNIPGNSTARRWRAAATAAMGLALAGGVATAALHDTPAPTVTPVAAAPAMTRVAFAPAVAIAAKPAAAAKAAVARTTTVAKHGWIFPMDGHVTSCPGPRWGKTHQGIDVGDVGAKGGSEIHAAARGKVVIAGFNQGGYGNMVIIKHADGHHTLYGHAQKVLVKAGQSVAAGQKIALEGSTGHSTGPHLHFEVQDHIWHRVNPVNFLESKGLTVKC